jgi:hypothetical protein
MALSATWAVAAGPINVEQIKKAYAANNRHDVPLVSWMEGGGAPGVKFLLYPDGELLVPNSRAKSGLGTVRISPERLRSILAQIEAQDEFWTLSSRYEVPGVILELPDNRISLHLPRRRAITVSVDAALTTGQSKQLPPRAFTNCLNLLKSLIPPHTIPWDPGYVEIDWADFSYGRGRSQVWPKQWPGLKGPLARRVKGWVIDWIVLFPSSRVTELDTFFARHWELQTIPILVDGRKLSGSYRWPLRGEKAWSTWNQ